MFEKTTKRLQYKSTKPRTEKYVLQNLKIPKILNFSISLVTFDIIAVVNVSVPLSKHYVPPDIF